MPHVSAPQHQARLLAGTMRIAIFLFYIYFTNPWERGGSPRIADIVSRSFSRPLLS
jgi:hypothetical protein